jgi:hypothetical protein
MSAMSFSNAGRAAAITLSHKKESAPTRKVLANFTKVARLAFEWAFSILLKYVTDMPLSSANFSCEISFWIRRIFTRPPIHIIQ